MRQSALMAIAVLFGIAAALVYSSAFIVTQTQMAVVLEFGKAKDPIYQPGLYWKIPLAQTVVYFEKKIIDIESTPKEVTATDQKRLIVTAFARYKIVDPLKFYQTVRNLDESALNLKPTLASALQDILGKAAFIDIVRARRDELMRVIAGRMNEKAMSLGIEVIDVRIKRADLPAQNSQSIFQRMQTQRKQEAAEIRAEGAEKAQGIRAGADREVTVIKAEALRDAERLRGEGDGERNHIYAAAFGKDPDFFAFYRSMQAYEESLKSGNTQFVISPNSEFFRYFNNPGSGEQKAGNK
jgi:modulator of FtsH protease HflC